MLAAIPLFVPLAERLKSGGLASIIEVAALMNVTRITLLPSQLSLLLRQVPNLQEVFTSLKLVIVSGESCPASLVSHFSSVLPAVTLLNLYGRYVLYCFLQ